MPPSTMGKPRTACRRDRERAVVSRRATTPVTLAKAAVVATNIRRVRVCFFVGPGAAVAPGRRRGRI